MTTGPLYPDEGGEAILRAISPYPDDVYFIAGSQRKPRHRHRWEWNRQLRKLICTNGCGKDYRGPTPAQTEARRKNFHKMFVLGNLVRARWNVRWGEEVDSVVTRVALEAIDILIERARAEL
jgi:hypothetical protein